LSLRNCRLAIIAFVLSWDPDWCQIHVGWKADESSLNFQEIQKYFLHIYQPCAKNFSLALAVLGILPSESPRHQPASSIQIAEKLRSHRDLFLRAPRSTIQGLPH